MPEDVMCRETDDTLWVLARVKESIYAIDGARVESILVLDSEIVNLPDSDDAHMGAIPFRDGFIPVLDFRYVVGLETRETEELRFEQMLEDRKQDHIRWVDALKSSAESGEPFKLATDPHLCAFGRWYDHYQSDSQTVSFHLKKIDEPHRSLHRMAVEMFECKQQHNECRREECVKTSLKKAMELYMPQVVHLLEEAKEVFRDSYRRMVVVISSETSLCGVLVDEVLSAEMLGTMVESCGLSGSETGTLVTHIGERKGIEGSVLVMDADWLFKKYS